MAPSNPVVSIGPILAVPGVAEALKARRDIGRGRLTDRRRRGLKGPADRLLVELGGEASAAGVARLSERWVGTLVIDAADAEMAGEVRAAGVRCVVAPTVMATPEIAADSRAAVTRCRSGTRRLDCGD